tara:strand:- start:78 stop:602 length:525 start_codon:yes stop_codon:yes gene_type:complete
MGDSTTFTQLVSVNPRNVEKTLLKHKTEGWTAAWKILGDATTEEYFTEWIPTRKMGEEIVMWVNLEGRDVDGETMSSAVLLDIYQHGSLDKITEIAGGSPFGTDVAVTSGGNSYGGVVQNSFSSSSYSTMKAPFVRYRIRVMQSNGTSLQPIVDGDYFWIYVEDYSSYAVRPLV